MKKNAFVKNITIIANLITFSYARIIFPNFQKLKITETKKLKQKKLK